jgi:uncharacterized protein involved in exopolysaccharide biosynthesis
MRINAMARLVILRLLDSYFRHRWLHLLPLVIMVGFASAAFALAEPQYVSRGKLYVQKSSLLTSLTQLGNDGFSWNAPSQSVINELNELVQTEAFVRSIIQKTDLEAKMSAGPEAVQMTIEEFRRSLSITMVGENVMEISVKNKDPKLAEQLTSATINAFSIWKLNGDRQESVVAQQFFAEVLPAYQKDLQDAREALRAYLTAHPMPLRGERTPQEQLELSQLQAAVDLASKRVESTLEKEESARLAQAQSESNARQNYLVIDAPVKPTKAEASLSQRLIGPAIFVIVGSILMLLCIVGAALLDRSFRLPLDVHRGLELPVLAVVPDVSQVDQSPVLNESTQTLSFHTEHNGLESTAVAQLPHKQRRGRQQIPAVANPSTARGEIADSSSTLPGQTTA